jgi:tetratricopeptide (TPR) repeat protein
MLTGLMLSTFNGCLTREAQLFRPQPESPIEDSQTKKPEDELSRGTAKISSDVLYKTIISELHANRAEFDEAGDNYLDLALQTKDLGILRRAIQFATLNNDQNALMQLALLWSDIDPLDSRPRRMLASLTLESGALMQSLLHMERIIELGEEIDFSLLSNKTGDIDVQSRNLLVGQLTILAKKFPTDTSIVMAMTQLLAQNNEFEAALEQLATFNKIIPYTPRIILLKAEILNRMNNPKNALKTLKDGTKKFRDNIPIRLNYARMLVRQNEFKSAITEFETLLDQDPDNHGARFSQALIFLETEAFKKATTAFKTLIASNQRVEEARYYLAYSLENQNLIKEAVLEYQSIPSRAENFVAAQQQATRLLIAQGEFNKAHESLIQASKGQPQLQILFITMESRLLLQSDNADRAKDLIEASLNRFPGEIELLFARVLYFDLIGDKQNSERDLKQIIRIQPDDSRALNHLGYMLATQTSRFEEANTLIERAIKISPEDPAIIDSLAWIQYKLGRFDKAFKNIARAYERFPDPEVASHMGEILWALNRRKDALSIWNQALEQDPNSAVIIEAMERLQSQ